MRDLIDDRLVACGLVEFVIEGLGDDLWALSFDEVYGEWHPGDPMVSA